MLTQKLGGKGTKETMQFFGFQLKFLLTNFFKKITLMHGLKFESPQGHKLKC